MRRQPVCRLFTACMPPSFPCSFMPSLVPAVSSFWGPIHPWQRSLPPWSCPGGGDPARTVALAGMLAIFTGLLCILAGLVRLGFITELLSKPIRYGYMNGIALTVLVSQLPKLFGFSAEGDGVLQETVSFIQGLLTGKTNWVTLAVGVSHPGLHPGIQAIQALPGCVGGGSGGDARNWRLRPGQPGRGVGRRGASPGIAFLYHSPGLPCRISARCWLGHRYRGGLFCRYQRALA